MNNMRCMKCGAEVEGRRPGLVVGYRCLVCRLQYDGQMECLMKSNNESVWLGAAYNKADKGKWVIVPLGCLLVLDGIEV